MPSSADSRSPEDRIALRRRIVAEARRGALVSCPEFLRSRVVDARAACQCCKATGLKTAAKLGWLFLDVLSALVDPAVSADESPDDPPELALAAGLVGFSSVSPLSPGQVVIPEMAPQPEIRGIPRSAIGARGAGLGAVVLLTWEVWREIARKDQTLEMVQTLSQLIPPLVKAATRTAAESCEKCVAESVLSQNSGQVRLFGPYRRRK